LNRNARASVHIARSAFRNGVDTFRFCDFFAIPAAAVTAKILRTRQRSSRLRDTKQIT